MKILTTSDEKIISDSGHARLHELGYKQELKRSLSVVSNFAFSFSIISVLTGVTTLYNTGLTYGGPASASIGWLVAAFFTMFVGLSMAEICSAYPTSGGLYYWSAKLSGKDWAPLASWTTGWFNIVGQWAVTTSVDFSFAQLLQVIVLLGTGDNNGGGYRASKYIVICFHGGVLLIHGIINSLSITWLSFFGQLGAAWNVIGVFVLMILIPTVATEKANLKFVFTHFNTENGVGIHNKFYIFVVGLLMSQYSLVGYDASAHMVMPLFLALIHSMTFSLNITYLNTVHLGFFNLLSIYVHFMYSSFIWFLKSALDLPDCLTQLYEETEETKDADKNGPKGIISAIGISIIFGWAYLLGITFAVTNIPYLLSSDNDAGGYAIAEVFYLSFKSRYGSGIGGIICLGIIAVAVFLCGISCVTSNSRMVYAFSRDGAMPLSPLWHKLNKQDVPVNAVWLSVLISFCMALPSLGSIVAFQAMVSIATIGLYIAYVLPTLFRVTLARKSFVPGPFNLGHYSIFVGWIAVLWVATISVLFSLPVAYPVTKDTLNYTPVAVGGLLILILSSWIISARYWFKGPITNLDT